MAQLKVVVCALDFTELSSVELALATEVCDVTGAHLVLHHNLSAVPPGITRAWEWNEVHRGEAESTAKVETQLREVLSTLPKSFSAEASLSSGPVAPVLLQMTEQLPADLLVLGSHGWSTPDHASLTERLIERCSCPVLTVNGVPEACASFHLRIGEHGRTPHVTVAVDFAQETSWPLQYACELARRVPIHLNLLHVVPEGGDKALAGERRQRLLARVPQDLTARASCFVNEGDPAEEIVRFSRQTDASFMIVGEHARGLLRRLFTHDTARDILHRAPCPVWFIPAGRDAP